MDATGRIQAIVAAADEAFTELARECMAARDYDGATAAIDAARVLSQIISPKSVGLPSQPSPPPQAVINSSPKPVRKKKDSYPKFVRDEDSLVKIGWSKSEKAEYEHKSPKSVLTALSQALIQAGGNGRRFSMDKVLPLNNPADSSPLPDYQCYLCLAWMRQSDLVVQHGRQGYSLHKKLDLPTAIENAWGKLPARS